MQKPSKEILTIGNDSSLLIRTFGKSAFDAPYHFHSEYELTYILQGKGKRFVGNNMSDFSEGDLVLLGPKLPHCWKLDNDAIQGSAIVIQFANDCMGESFFNHPEFVSIQSMLQKSASGIYFHDAIQKLSRKKLITLSKETNSFFSFVNFLQLLQALANTPEYTLLDRQNTIADWTDKEQERINAVYAYLVENFKEEISLDKVAAIAHMSPNAFCKYFKKVTRKTLIETVIDYRIGYATQQLIQTDKSISDISFNSGFGDVSHFYKIFRSRMNISPLHYRKNFMKDIDGN